MDPISEALGGIMMMHAMNQSSSRGAFTFIEHELSDCAAHTRWRLRRPNKGVGSRVLSSHAAHQVISTCATQFAMDSELDEPYENVVFRNSQIVYPPDLVTGSISDSCHLQVDSNSSDSSRPRRSVLEAFDPVLQRKSTSSSKNQPSNSEILSTLEVDPPPLPQRNPKAQVFYHGPLPAIDEPPPAVPIRGVSKRQHAYDPVTLETEKSEYLETLINEETLSQSITSRTMDNIKGRMNKMTNRNWLPNLKRNSAYFEREPITSIDTPSYPELGHAGNLAWLINSGLRKEPQILWTELKNGMLSCFSGISGDSTVHTVKLETLLSIGVCPNEDSLSFEIRTSNEKSKIVLTAGTYIERIKWMEWILESTDPEAFTKSLRSCYDRCGRVFIKEGVTGEWRFSWILLQTESKQLWLQRKHGQLDCEDLRKVRSITQPVSGDIADCPFARPGAAPIIIHWSDHTTYILSNSKADTESWLQVTRNIALHSGESIEENQLTIDDVPVLVECCVKFIETYGMLAEGIYRRSGVQSKVVRLLALLRNDAWNVHISNQEYTEHDVANVLKRFLRTLPEPLLSNELYSQWIAGLNMEQDNQLKLYKHLIECLPKVNRRTLGKLLGHLHVVQNKCEKNLMTVSNLAALWGPTLMTVESGRDHTSNFSHTNAETDVVRQLIQYYPWLFDVDREKLAVNDQISEVQERLEQGALGLKKSAGDIRTWIYSELIAKDVAVEIGPKVKVRDIFENLRVDQAKSAFLMESICNGDLRRPLNGNELLLPTILKWADWAEDNRKSNQLVYGTHGILTKFLIEEKFLPQKTMFELHYADQKGKTFRSYPFEFCQARFTLLKDVKSRTVLCSWDLENIIWYLGSDQRRNSPTNWCITFIEKDSSAPKKGRYFLGHCLSFNCEKDLLKMLKAIMMTEFEGGLASYFQ